LGKRSSEKTDQIPHWEMRAERRASTLKSRYKGNIGLFHYKIKSVIFLFKKENESGRKMGFLQNSSFLQRSKQPRDCSV